MLLKTKIMGNKIIIVSSKTVISYNIKTSELDVGVRPLELYSKRGYDEYLSILYQEIKQLKKEKELICNIVKDIIKLDSLKDIEEYVKQFNNMLWS